MADAIDRFAEHAVSNTYDALPNETINSAKKFIIDTIGVGILGSSAPWASELIHAHGSPQNKRFARVIGSGSILSAESAALCNAYQMHNSEFDCFHEAAVIHPVTCVLAASLAEIDQVYFDKNKNVSGKLLINAVSLGVDIACNIGAASNTGLQFFRPGTCGAFGATAAIGILRRFSKVEMSNAFGIVFSQLCGTMQAHTEGSPLLGMQMGFNARNALIACNLAQQGIPSPKNILEGRYGYFQLFEGEHSLHEVLPTLGQKWRINEVSHKPFPSGRATHGIIDGCLRLRSKNTPIMDNIKTIEVHAPSLVHHLVGRPVKKNMDINYAKLCGQFTAARAFITGQLSAKDFQEDVLKDTYTLNQAKKIILHIDDNPNPNILSPLSVKINYTDGLTLTENINYVYGDPANPMPRSAWLEKFNGNWDSSITALNTHACKRVIEQFENLENELSVVKIIDNLFPGIN